MRPSRKHANREDDNTKTKKKHKNVRVRDIRKQTILIQWIYDPPLSVLSPLNPRDMVPNTNQMFFISRGSGPSNNSRAWSFGQLSLTHPARHLPNQSRHVHFAPQPRTRHVENGNLASCGVSSMSSSTWIGGTPFESVLLKTSLYRIKASRIIYCAKIPWTSCKTKDDPTDNANLRSQMWTRCPLTNKLE